MYIYFKLPPKKVLTYQVSTKSSGYLSRSLENKVQYKCTLTLREETMKGYLVNIKRSDISLNGLKEQSPINELLLIAGEVLSDLDLEISKYGKILKIRNIQSIQEKWITIKFKIENTYKGEIVERLLAPIHLKMQSENEIITSLEQDPFYYHYLSGIYTDYSNRKCEFEGNLWGIDKGPLQVTKFNKFIDNDPNYIYIDYLMKIKPEDVNRWALNISESDNNESLEANLSGRYSFSKEQQIESIAACYEVFSNQQLLKQVNVDIQLETK